MTRQTLTPAQKRRRRPKLAARDGQAQIDATTWECLQGASSAGHDPIDNPNCDGRAKTIDHADANKYNNAIGNLRLTCQSCNSKHRENMLAAREVASTHHHDGFEAGPNRHDEAIGVLREKHNDIDRQDEAERQGPRTIPRPSTWEGWKSEGATPESWEYMRWVVDRQIEVRFDTDLFGALGNAAGIHMQSAKRHAEVIAPKAQLAAPDAEFVRTFDDARGAWFVHRPDPPGVNQEIGEEDEEE